MPIVPMIMMTVGALAALLLVFVAFSGPSTSKALSRRLSSAKDRHASSATASIEAQMRKAISARQSTKMDSVASQILPNPALLKQRIGRTGKSWTLGQYGVASLSLAVGVAMLAMLQGAPWALSTLLGVMLGLAIPHMTISHLIKKRIRTFTVRFPMRSNCSCAVFAPACRSLKR